MALTYDGTYWRIQDSNLIERMHNAETEINQTATSITSLAAMNDTYTDPDGNTVANKAKSYVDQTATGITQTVSSTYATKTELSDMASGAEITKEDSSKREIITEDAAELPLITLAAYGENVQDGTPTPESPVPVRVVGGKNLLPKHVAGTSVINGVTFTVNDDGTITANGTATTDATFIVAGGQTSGSGLDIELSSNSIVSLGVSGSSNTFVGVTWGQGGGQTAATFTETRQLNTGFTLYGLGLRIISGYTCNNLVFKPQLEAGTIATPYTPYGCISAITTGKNLVPPAAGIGRIQANGTPYTAAGDGDLHRYSPYIPVLPDTQYTLSVDYSQLDGNKYLPIAWYAKDGTFISRPYNWSGAAYIHQTLTSPSNAAYARTSAREECYETSLQLELGTEATEYEPYRESVSYIDLKGEELCSLPDGTHDVLTIDASGHAVIEKRVDSLTKAIADMGDSQDYPGWRNSGISEIIGSGINSNIGHSTALSNIKDSGIVYGANTQDGDLLFLTRAYYGLTSDEWKAQYPNLLVTVYAKRAEPRTVDLGYIDLPTTFPNGAVRVVAEIQPVIDGSWWTAAGYEAGKAYGEGNRSADLAALTERVTTAESSIEQNAGQIALKANSSDVYTKSGVDGLISAEVSNRNAAITAKAGEIASDVSATYATKDSVSGVEQRVSSAESSITQQAGEIASKVSTTDYTGAKVASLINQSADSVKIQAKHVEIDGTAIFSAISDDVDDAITDKGYQTASQVDTAITSKGYQTSSQVENAITSKGYATTSQMNTAIENAVDAIEIGGRNLLKGTADITGDVGGGGVAEWGTDSMFGGVKTAKTQSSWTGIYMKLVNIADAMVAGEKYTASVYVKTDEDRDVPFSAHRFTHKTNVGDGSLGTHSLKAGVWEQLSITFTATEGDDSSKTTTSARIESSQAVPLWWAAPKLERGTKPTAWTPAPEDTDAAIAAVQTVANAAAPKTSAVSRTQRIYYRTNTALTSSITGPTT